MHRRPTQGVSGPPPRTPEQLSRLFLAAVALALLPPGFLLIDPWVLGLARGLEPALVEALRGVTDIGKANWMLLLTGAGAGLFYWRYQRAGRRIAAAAYAHAAQLFGFVFAAVAGAGIAASLIKNILGRARPRHFDELGAADFTPFAFAADLAAFPSGHTTNLFALAGALTVLWPRMAVPALGAAGALAATRFLIGAHYFTDVMGGAVLGLAFAYALRDRLAARRWLFERRGDATILRAARLRRWLTHAARTPAKR